MHTDNTELPTEPRLLAVVTGASTGIGLELARLCAQRQWDLIIAADEPLIEDAARELAGMGVSCTPVEHAPRCVFWSSGALTLMRRTAYIPLALARSESYSLSRRRSVFIALKEEVRRTYGH